MPDFMVVVRMAEQRFVKADDPIDAITKALAPGRETDDELWEWDYGVERIHIYDENDVERRIRLPKDILAEINSKLREGYRWHESIEVVKKGEDRQILLDDDGQPILEMEELDSWAEIRQGDIDRLPTLSLAEAAKLSLELSFKEKITQAVKEEEPVEVKP